MKITNICALLIMINTPVMAQIEGKTIDPDFHFAFSEKHRRHSGLVYGLMPFEGKPDTYVLLNDISFNKYRFHLRDKNRKYDLYFYEDHSCKDYITDLNSEIRTFRRAVIDLGFYKLDPNPFDESQYVILPAIDTFCVTDYFKAIAKRIYKEEELYLAIVPVKYRDGAETAHYRQIADKIQPSSRLFYILIKDNPGEALKGFRDNEDIKIVLINKPFKKPESLAKAFVSERPEIVPEPLAPIAEVKEPETAPEQEIIPVVTLPKPAKGYYIQLHGDTTETIQFTFHSILSSRTGKDYRNRSVKAKEIIALPLDAECIPRSFNDRLRVIIQKPEGYNLLNLNDQDSPYNRPTEKQIIVEAYGDDQIDLMLTRLTAYHIVYIDLSGTVNRQRVVGKIQELIHYLNQSKDDYMIFTSNHQRPLVINKQDIMSDTRGLNDYLIPLLTLNPDPPSLTEDKRRIETFIDIKEIGKSHEAIINHIFISDTYSGQYTSMIDNLSWQINNKRAEMKVYHDSLNHVEGLIRNYVINERKNRKICFVTF